MEKGYGAIPQVVGKFDLKAQEMFFYQDMPIKLKRFTEYNVEPRLDIFKEVIDAAIQDFILEFGIERYINSYVYISAKHLFQPKSQPFNRPGWHCDGFMSEDINYVWSDKNPTIFNDSMFDLTQDHDLSIREMEEQALEENNFTLGENTLVRLDQYNVHKVAEVDAPGMRTFLKVSFSKDRFDLIGNTHNYELFYNWEMKPRAINRNVPQSKTE